MTLRAVGDPPELERRAAENPAGMRALVDSALTDVWSNRERFEAYAASHIMPAVAAVGLEGPPRIEYIPVHNHFSA